MNSQKHKLSFGMRYPMKRHIMLSLFDLVVAREYVGNFVTSILLILSLQLVRPLDAQDELSNVASGAGESIHVEYLDVIQLDNGQVLPLNLIYGLASPTISMLGKGWCFPLIDSSAFLLSEDKVSVLLPNGKSIIVPVSMDKLASRANRHWAANATRGDITVFSPDGTQFVFLNGRISRILCPDGTDVHINRSSPGNVIVACNSKVLVSMQASKDEVFVKTKLNNFKFVVNEKMPRVSNLAESVISGFDKTLSSVDCNGKRLLDAAIEVGAGGVSDLRYSLILNGEDVEKLPIPFMGKVVFDSESSGNGQMCHFDEFRSGILTGRVRTWKYKSAPESPLQTVKFIYDENARLIRAEGSTGTLTKNADGSYVLKTTLDDGSIRYTKYSTLDGFFSVVQ